MATTRPARCCRSRCTAPSSPTSVKEIAERTGLPQPYLEQILLAVKGAGLVRSKRGVGGGYVLARPPEEITLADIVAAVDGPLTTLMGEHDHCEGHCVLQEVWVGVSRRPASSSSGSRSPTSSSAPASVTPRRSSADAVGKRCLPGEAGEHRVELGRAAGSVDSHPLPGRGMRERERGSRAGTDGRARSAGARAAVRRVTDDRMSDGAAGAHGSGACDRSRAGTRAASTSGSRVRREHLVRGARRAAALADRHPRAASHATARSARRSRHVARRDAPRRARGTHARLRGAASARRACRTRSACARRASRPLVSRSRRCTIPGRCGSPTSRELGEAREQPVHERPGGMPGARVHDEPGRLRDHDHVVVLVAHARPRPSASASGSPGAAAPRAARRPRPRRAGGSSRPSRRRRAPRPARRAPAPRSGSNR